MYNLWSSYGDIAFATAGFKKRITERGSMPSSKGRLRGKELRSRQKRRKERIKLRIREAKLEAAKKSR